MSLYEELGEDVKQKFNTVQQLSSLIKGFIQKSNDKSNQENQNNTSNQSVQKQSQQFSEAIEETTPLSLGTNEAFTFSGQMTDLCYFNHCDAMPFEAIMGIENIKLREAVTDNLQKAYDSGLVTFRDNMIVITDKGRKAIREPSFVKAAQKDQIKAYNRVVNDILSNSCKENEVQMGIELSGSYTQDFAFFNYTDSMDLSFIKNHPDRETAEKISKNISKWADKGFVTIDNVANKAIITQKGKNVLTSAKFNQATQAVAEKALSSIGGTVGKIAVATKKVVSAVQNVQKATNAISKGSR